MAAEEKLMSISAQVLQEGRVAAPGTQRWLQGVCANAQGWGSEHVSGLPRKVNMCGLGKLVKGMEFSL